MLWESIVMCCLIPFRNQGDLVPGARSMVSKKLLDFAVPPPPPPMDGLQQKESCFASRSRPSPQGWLASESDYSV